MARRKLETGDLFSFPVTDREWAAGRVLLDVKKQCVQARRLPPDSPLLFFGGALLIEVYTPDVSAEASAERADAILPGIFVAPPRDDWPALARRPVDPTQVEFPMGLLGGGSTVVFEWGEVSIRLALSTEEADPMKISPPIVFPIDLPAYCLHRLNRTAEIDRERNPSLDALDLSTRDLRFALHRDRILHLAGVEPGARYYDVAFRSGHDTRRFYQ